MGCKSNVVSDRKSALYLSQGKFRARRSWSRKAFSRYGWRYRKWSKAKGRDYYVYADGTDFLLWKVRAFGRPCR
jgi:hypothetical protein